MDRQSTAGWGLFEGITFKVATTESERLSALELQREVYQEDLGHVPVADQDEVAHLLIAQNEAGEVIAGFRIIGPESRPFDVETSVDIGALIGPDRSPGLIGRLVIRRDYRRVRRAAFLHMGMLKLAYAFAVSRAITDLLLYTYPNLIKFYRGSFFDITEIVFDHPEWGQVHLMHMDVVALPGRCANSRSTLARLLSVQGMPNFVV